MPLTWNNKACINHFNAPCNRNFGATTTQSGRPCIWNYYYFIFLDAAHNIIASYTWAYIKSFKHVIIKANMYLIDLDGWTSRCLQHLAQCKWISEYSLYINFASYSFALFIARITSCITLMIMIIMITPLFYFGVRRFNFFFVFLFIVISHFLFLTHF